MIHILRVFAVLCLGLWATFAVAQPNGDAPIDVATWKALSARAERAIDADRASDEALETLRAEIAAYRQRFAEARDENATRIRTVQSQLDALGPRPEDGVSESETISATRAGLDADLERLRAPQVVAEAAYTRANGLVAEIDAMLRARQAQALFTRGPVPWNPALWPEALRELTEFARGITNETRSALDNQVERRRAASSIPLALVLSLGGLVLIARGRRLSARVGDYFRTFGGSGSGVWSFVVSLGRIFIPLLGLYLITRAVQVTELAGQRGAAVMDAIPVWGAILLGFGWLGERVFIARDGDGLLPDVAQGRAQIRATIWTLAVVLVLKNAADLVIRVEQMSNASAAVVLFPIVVLAAVVLYRLIAISRPNPQTSQAEDNVEDDDDQPVVKSGLFRIMPPIRAAAQIIAILAPLAAAAGYLAAAEATIYPMIWTLALIAMAAIVQRFIAGAYGWATGSGVAAVESLFSVLVGFVLAALCIPAVALVWGVREADLGELWSRFLDGVSIGGTRISPLDFLAFLVIFALGFGITRLLQGALKTSLLPKTQIDPGGQNAIVSGIGYIGIFLAAVAAITGAGINLSSLAIVAGALSVGIGFGLQTIVSNFVSGIILLIERPVSEGDWIEVAGTMGIVKDISVRATRIETFDRTDVIVPNSDLISGAVTNYTRTPVGRVILPVGVAYGTDTRWVEQILLEIAEGHPMVLARPAPFVVFQGFGADSLDFELRVIIRDISWGLSVRTELNHAIAERFAKEGIEIPFAQRDVWLRNPETLAKPTAPMPSTAPAPTRELDPGEASEGDGPSDGPATGVS